jgi:hypothetical protein
MSQPPPPPGNPPPYGQSGGAVPPPPQGPPPAGYGYPAQSPPPPPPPSPGYGYPAQGPPAADNPYANPVPPGQNPYAAPTQPAFPQTPPQQGAPPQGPPPPPPPHPGQQPPQPYPGQQPQPPYGQQQYGQIPPQNPYGYGYQQQPAPGGSGKNKLVVIVAAVVAAVLVIGGGVYFATKGGGDDPKPKPVADSSGTTGGTDSAKPNSAPLSLKWNKPADTVTKKENLKDAVGVWFTDKYVVKNEIDKVVAYDLTSGAQAWSIPTPSRGDCTAARDSYNDTAAVQYGASCDKIMAIDLAAGKQLWTQELPAGTGTAIDFDYTEMAISGNAVGVDWLQGSIAYRLTDHKVLWKAGDDACEDDGYAGGKQFVAVINCDLDTYKVQLVDPANNGAAKWTWTAPTGTRINAIVSTDPVVVLLGTEATTFTDVATIVGGRLQSRVSLGTDKYEISDDGTEKQAVHNVLVDSTTLYLTLRSQAGSNGNVLSGIVAFNLSDGKQKWVAKPSDNHDITGVAFQDGKLLAFEPPDYDVQGALVTLDPATGAISPYATFAKDAYDQLDSGGLDDYYVWHGGQFYYVSRTVYSTSDADRHQQYLQVYG